MKRTALIAVAVSAAAAAALAGVSPAGGKPARSSVTLTLTSKLDQATAVDNAPTGRSAGDTFVFTEKLFDSRGKDAGSDAATCTLLFDERSLCTGVYVLTKGQVMVQLLQPGPTGTYTQPITGGTGAYQGARGTVTVKQSAAGDQFTLRIRLAN